MSYIFAGNLRKSRERVRRTRGSGSKPQGWGDFRQVTDTLRSEKGINILYSDGSRDRNVSLTEIYEVES